MPASDHGFEVASLSDEQLAQLRRDVLSEQSLRRRLDASPEKIERAIAEYQKASGKGMGEQWEQPLTALQAYRAGATVEHDGQTWVSTVANNVWEPGQSGWRLAPVLDDEGNEVPPPYVAPTGAHDAYQQGDRITWEGDVYEAVRDGVVHSPGEYAPDWERIVFAAPLEPAEPEPEDPDEAEGDEPTEPEEPEAEQPAEWVQPTGGHDAYNTGDRATYQGAVYVSLINGNVWSPGDHPQGWETDDAA